MGESGVRGLSLSSLSSQSGKSVQILRSSPVNCRILREDLVDRELLRLVLFEALMDLGEGGVGRSLTLSKENLRFGKGLFVSSCAQASVGSRSSRLVWSLALRLGTGGSALFLFCNAIIGGAEPGGMPISIPLATSDDEDLSG